MELNIGIVAVVAILAILLIFFTIRRNLRDQKDLENTINETELGPDRHKEDRI